MSSRQVCRFVIPLIAAVMFAAAARPLAAAVSPSRPPLEPDASEIQLELDKLGTLGSVLYIAAHPDDENTALLTWLSRERHLRVGYLAMTRGDGGQNLLGTEVGSALGVIRTQELMAARRIDGAEQYFTRAIDFGYSKSTDEALAMWGHDEILSDVVRVIRRFRPDVIITRFTPTRGGHGHHTASALLAEEAFAAAADPNRFPEQLAEVGTWQAKRLMWNAFRFGSMPDDSSVGGVTVDLGAYNPLLGRSYTEIAGESRSMHKSQGFGAAERRGTYLNRLVPTAGEPARDDFMDGVDTGWTRVRGGAQVGRLVEEVKRRFDPRNPAASVDGLFAVRRALDALRYDPWVEVKRAELDELIRACAGLWIEAVAQHPTATPGEAADVTLSVLERSEVPFRLDRAELVQAGRPAPGAGGVTAPVPLRNDVPVDADVQLTIPADTPLTQPYWLAAPPDGARFHVDEPSLIGLAETPAVVTARFTLTHGGQSITFEVPLLYRWVDRVEGERYRRFEIAPPATARFENPVAVFADVHPREIGVVVRGHRDGVTGTVALAPPRGWTVTPASMPVSLKSEGDEVTLRFTVTPGANAETGPLGAAVTVDGKAWNRGLVTIDYPHIPRQDLFPPAEARLVRVPLATRGTNIGYLMGSGDAIPEALRQVGYRVTLLDDDQVAGADLAGYDAIVAGVRAYNTRPRLLALQPRLLEYVKNGGTLVVQYNTAQQRLNDALGPWPFTITHDRVTDETAKMTFVNPRHPLLNTPNRITAADFDGWVQERGLYFANPWDAKYDTVLAAHDAGEDDLAGGLLYGRYGRGVFIYTGFSFFRELPAGVPGAYRLFVNLVSARP